MGIIITSRKEIKYGKLTSDIKTIAVNRGEYQGPATLWLFARPAWRSRGPSLTSPKQFLKSDASQNQCSPYVFDLTRLSVTKF